MASVWYGGGLWGALGLAAGTFLVACIFVLSFWYGTKNITLVDTATLAAAFFAIVIWLTLHDPLLALFTVTIIDMLGYIPTMRKSHDEPWSETVSTWALWCVGNILAIVALSEYNLLTLTYIIAITTANSILITICLLRRRIVPKPAPAV